MRDQAIIKRLTGGIVVGLLLLGASPRLGYGQSAATPNDVRKVLSQPAQPTTPQTQVKTPAPAKPATASTTSTGQTKPTTPATAATSSTAKASQTKPAAPSSAPATAAAAKDRHIKPGPTPATAKANEAKPAVAQTKAPVAATASKAAAQPGARPAVTPAVAVNPTAPELKPAVEHSNVARRDPFDPLVNKEKDTPGPQAPLPAGKPGLVVATLRVDGIVRDPNGMIAVVSNPQMRVYFLHEGDHLYDGDVSHITMEGVTFHENGKDAFGKAVEREITKRLYPTPGEQQ